MLVSDTLAQTENNSDKQLVTNVECDRILADIRLWDEVVERATLHLISNKIEITIPNIVNELTLMGYEVVIHELALKHLIMGDIKKIVASVSIL